MAVKHARVTVGTTATVLVPTADNDRLSGCELRLFNSSLMVSLYVGGPGVTAATGYELAPGSRETFRLTETDKMIYGAVATATVEVHVLQTGV